MAKTTITIRDQDGERNVALECEFDPALDGRGTDVTEAQLLALRMLNFARSHNGSYIESTFEEIINLAERMHEELKSLCDAAYESGSPMPAAEELLDEWQTLREEF